MATDLPPADPDLDREPVDEDRPVDPDEAGETALPDEDRPLDPADATPPPPLDDDRPVRLDDDED